MNRQFGQPIANRRRRHSSGAGLGLVSDEDNVKLVNSFWEKIQNTLLDFLSQRLRGNEINTWKIFNVCS